MAKQKEFESNGQKYIFQRPPLSYVGKMTDDSKDQNGRLIPEKYYRKIMENVIVSPNVDFSFFDEIEQNKEKTFKPYDTEYTFVYPGAKKIAEMEYDMQDGRGAPSELKTHEQLMKHIIRVDGEEVSFDFFEESDEVGEFFEVIDEAAKFFKDNEFKEVVGEAVAFFRGKKK
ncbi:hypothetical protein G4V62_13795 [Bacillaceae bacterium SIJ1]|uniref:hypothetical protein n=1 Tax=Litoribacterium kuwaitense TaxID=1398745 RepID=UPI0013ED0F98|nr:hypothetical protein [Litoribacterium kuwaitense]NGP45967.1 hypothetical protein [Litoribacterium kuwaitense]